MTEDTHRIYTTLLDLYNAEVDELTRHLQQSGETGTPSAVINSRMTIFDNHLLGPLSQPYYYKIKQKLMPLIVEYLACYDAMKEEERAQFENEKPRKGHYLQLEQLLSKFNPLETYVQSQIKNEKQREDRLVIPWPPKKANATRQMQEYELEKKKFDEERQEIDENIQELENLLKTYNSIKLMNK